ncbi:MAG: proline--tRNA ligase [Chloroflexi bacterium 13_1_40CM_65_17]|nr:MAG: proline--tRNA ligase [Chloroflexi bacterium 13_1_40CM_65_17]
MKQETEEQQDFVKDITKMSDDFDRWYTDVVRKAELADWSGVRGMMVVRPYGWAMWEAITRAFDDMIKESGHENWAFPLLIPRSYLMKEAEHVEGFAPEVAWVTRAGGDMEELEEPLAVRPTSETIIGALIKRYIQSHRDLPKLTNQWNSVVRWEMRSRLFLRSREFWWQEGHTFHASGQEAMDETQLILDYYRSIAEDWLAVPVLSGKKSPAETFPGAVYTLTVEGLMRDGLALQMGTSHYFGQNFARAYDISFSNTENERELCHSTSWGISTRLVGALVMAHGDDSGLLVPPKVAPIQVVVVPIFRDAESRSKVEGFIDGWARQLKAAGIRHRIDWRDERPGDKYAHWELKGVPLRLNVGARDVDAGQVELVDRLSRERRPLPVTGIADRLQTELTAYQSKLFARAQEFQRQNTFELSTLDEVVAHFRERAGFVWATWCGDAECEAKIKAAAGGVTIRTLDPDEKATGKCLVCGKPAKYRVSLAKAY